MCRCLPSGEGAACSRRRWQGPAAAWRLSGISLRRAARCGRWRKLCTLRFSSWMTPWQQVAHKATTPLPGCKAHFPVGYWLEQAIRVLKSSWASQECDPCNFVRQAMVSWQLENTRRVLCRGPGLPSNVPAAQMLKAIQWGHHVWEGFKILDCRAYVFCCLFKNEQKHFKGFFFFFFPVRN